MELLVMPEGGAPFECSIRWQYVAAELTEVKLLKTLSQELYWPGLELQPFFKMTG